MDSKKYTKKDPFYCVICEKKYDNSSNRPYCLMPCGHTYCRICIENNLNQCPVCEAAYNQYIPDYNLLDQITGVKGLSLNEKSYYKAPERSYPSQNDEEPVVVVSNSVYGRKSRSDTRPAEPAKTVKPIEALPKSLVTEVESYRPSSSRNAKPAKVPPNPTDVSCYQYISSEKYK